MSSPARSKGAASHEELLALPGNVVAEIIDGELYASPGPALFHAIAGAALRRPVHAGRARLPSDLAVPFMTIAPDAKERGTRGW